MLPELPELPPLMRDLITRGDRSTFFEIINSSMPASTQALLEVAHCSLQLGLQALGDESFAKYKHLSSINSPLNRSACNIKASLALFNGEELKSADLACSQLASLYLEWRHCPDSVLIHEWSARVRTNWRVAAEYDQLALLGIILGRVNNLADMEAKVIGFIGEDQVEEDPKSALSFWGPVSKAAPTWTYARLKAADLSILANDLNGCECYLEAATADQQIVPWLWDIKARLSICRCSTSEALGYWDEAMRLCIQDQDTDLANLMRERRNKAMLESEWIAEPQIFKQPTGDHLLDVFSNNLDSWASRVGICLSSNIDQPLLDIDEWNVFLERQIAEITTDGSSLSPLS